MAKGWRYNAARWLLPEVFTDNPSTESPAPVGVPADIMGPSQNPPLEHGAPVVLPDDIPFIIAAADTGNTSAKSLAGELGVTGLDVRSGRIYQEYNSTLQTLSSRMVAYEEMRRSDSAPAAMEAITTLPLREANWHIEPGDDKALAERIERNLRDELTNSFDDTLSSGVLARFYGFTIHEKVFETKNDGFVGWRKFAERDRSTVYSWQFDSTGGLAGIVQHGRNPQTSEMQTHEIPVAKLLVWTWRGESGNPEGIGAFRQAYKHWMYKQYLEEFAAIRIERQACGIPIAYGPPENYNEAERDAVLAILKRIRIGKDAGIVVPDGWRIELLDLGPATVPFETHLERQHQSMLQTILGQFVGLGSGGDSGAWALSRDSSSFYLMSLEGVSSWQCDYFNRYVIPQIVKFNTNEKYKQLPRLVRGSIGVRETAKFSLMLKHIFLGKERLPEDIEAWAREELDMPAMSEKSTRIETESNKEVTEGEET